MIFLRRAPSVVCAGFLACAILLSMSPGRAEADVIHLRTGESVKGRPLRDKSDKKVLVIEDLLSGSVRTIAWSAVDPKDRDRLLQAWDRMNQALTPVEGHRITIELEGGARFDVRGLILSREGESYRVLRGGKELEVRKATVVGVSAEEIDPRDIWSPAQLVERFLGALGKEEGVDLDKLTSQQHFNVADYAQTVGAFETAKLHYAASAGDAEFESAVTARERLVDVEAILKDATALKALRRVRDALRQSAFRKARSLLEAFSSAHPDPNELIQRQLVKTRKEFARTRTRRLQLDAKIHFPKILLKLIRAKVKEKDIGLSDVTAWTRRELPDQAFEALATRMNKLDDVAPEEARAFWENRSKTSWRTASYGSGTFIVEPPKRPPPNRRPKSKKGGSKTGATPIKPPKPPTRDQWWQKARTDVRTYWTMAYFVENSGLFETSVKHRICSRCNGTGEESRRLPTGRIYRYTCTRCGGAQSDRLIKYR